MWKDILSWAAALLICLGCAATISLGHPAAEFAPKPGKRFGGAIMQLQFTAGNKPGKYLPTLALLRDPSNHSSGDGSRYTYTIVVE